METYVLEMKITTREIWSWFWEMEYGNNGRDLMAGRLVSRLKNIAPEYRAIYKKSTHRFNLPSESLIMLGLKHIGLGNCPGVMGYAARGRTLSDYYCIIAVELPIAFRLGTEHGICLSSQEQIIVERIERFFYPIINGIWDFWRIPNSDQSKV